MNNLATIDNNPHNPPFFDLFFRNVFDSETWFQPIPEIKKYPYPIDISTLKDNSLKIEIPALGLNKKDININIENDELQVSYDKSEQSEQSEKESKEYIHKGITRKSFDLAWKISSFDSKKIDAKLDKGLLTITIPAKEKQINKIEIH